MELNSNTRIVTLTILTGLIHLMIGIRSYSENREFLDLTLILNGAQYLFFATLFTLSFIKGRENFLTKNKRFFYLQYIGFTIVTIISYFAVWGVADGLVFVPGVITKLIEIALVYSLYSQFRSL